MWFDSILIFPSLYEKFPGSVWTSWETVCTSSIILIALLMQRKIFTESTLSTNQSTVSGGISTNESAPLFSVDQEGSCQYHAVQNTGQQTRRILAQLWKYFISDWNTETLATSFYYNLKYWWIEVSVICQVLSSEFFHNKNWAYWEERLTSQRHQYDQQNISTKTGWYHIVASPALLCRKEPAPAPKAL